MTHFLRTAEFDRWLRTWLLLSGGDKSSQQRDIRRARRLLDALEHRP